MAKKFNPVKNIKQERRSVPAPADCYVGPAFSVKLGKLEFIVTGADEASLRLAWTTMGISDPLEMDRCRQVAVFEKQSTT